MTVTSRRDRWRLAAYAVASVLAAAVSACLWGIPLPLGDNVAFLLEVQHLSLWEVLRERFLATNYLRPFYWGQLKLLLEASNGHYFVVFRGLHVLQFVAVVLLFVRAADVRGAAGFVALSIAVTALLGLHTLTRSLTEGPLTAVLCVAVAVNLSFSRAPSAWRDAAAVLLLVYAAFSVEVGLLVWVTYAAAFLAGCRGLSWKGVAASTAVVAIYFALRLVLLPSAGQGLPARETGVGFSIREPAAAVAALGGRPQLHAYNIASAVGSVLFSEPREGVWQFVRRAREDELAPWLWINVATSTLTTLCLLPFAVASLGRWRRGTMTREDRLVIVFGAVLAASAAMSFSYTRDAIMGPAGMLYALAAYAAFHAFLLRLPMLRAPARAVAAAVLIAAAIGWAVRAGGLTYLIRDAAFETRNDWAMAIERLEFTGHMPDDEEGRALVHALRRDALERVAPNPHFAQPWAEEYFDRLF